MALDYLSCIVAPCLSLDLKPPDLNR